ncbi:unnamed protein product [Linum trigynum]|uniref:Uncharacterized protein n=1 Tax=Linum trigynum TaxID=586398 RepID=A0AAV2G4W9_9ROSI
MPSATRSKSLHASSLASNIRSSLHVASPVDDSSGLSFSPTLVEIASLEDGVSSLSVSTPSFPYRHHSPKRGAAGASQSPNFGRTTRQFSRGKTGATVLVKGSKQWGRGKRPESGRRKKKKRRKPFYYIGL